MPFWLPPEPHYSIVESMEDSVRFILECSLTSYYDHLCAKASFLDPDGRVMEWHDFGVLEGPGWAANAVGGAYQLLRFARYKKRVDAEWVALSLVDHILEDGFVEPRTGFIVPYRHIPQDRFVLNFKADQRWLCPGAMARIAFQMLQVSDLTEGHRKTRLIRSAQGASAWMKDHIKPLSNGWFPRRVTPEGLPYPYRAEGGEDPIFAISGDGLHILLLEAELLRRGLNQESTLLKQGVEAFVKAGGFFGSVNHDTYDPRENVAYAIGFRALRRAGEVLGDRKLIDFAYEVCLQGLDAFKMKEDRNGVATQGLLWMEESWDTAYLWENAEAALAYVEAYKDRRRESYLQDALTILRAIAKHHHGKHGFLTEGVDWNNRVGTQHHINGDLYGDIQYTEPLLNNLHHSEATLELLDLFSEEDLNRI